MKAVNPEVATYAVRPVVTGYSDDADLPQVVAAFVQRCKGLGVRDTDINVLVRSKELLNVVLPGSLPTHVDPWPEDSPLARPLALSKYLRERGLHANAIRTMERALYRAQHPGINGAPAFKEMYAVAADLKRRGEIMMLLDELPSTSGTTLGPWIAAAAQTFEKLNLRYPLRIKKSSATCNYGALSFPLVFGSANSEMAGPGYRLQTVHAAKGQSMDAVLLILKKKAGRSKFYVNLLDQSITESEELRIVYVGLTRAKRVLEITVPVQDVPTWQKHVNGVG